MYYLIIASPPLCLSSFDCKSFEQPYIFQLSYRIKWGGKMKGKDKRTSTQQLSNITKIKNETNNERSNPKTIPYSHIMQAGKKQLLSINMHIYITCYHIE